MKPHARIGVGVRSIGIGKSCLHPGDETVRARLCSGDDLESLHAIVDTAGRGSKRPILDLDSLGTVARKELGLEADGRCVVGNYFPGLQLLMLSEAEVVAREQYQRQCHNEVKQ